ncbi:hypothetical protein B0H13DRAFT_2300789 [Mycena leptocephala]|nr:hypothetical protein B0H13DRAFT_2300789 [Mycena leptocephala]
MPHSLQSWDSKSRRELFRTSTYPTTYLKTASDILEGPDSEFHDGFEKDRHGSADAEVINFDAEELLSAHRVLKEVGGVIDLTAEDD